MVKETKDREKKKRVRKNAPQLFTNITLLGFAPHDSSTLFFIFWSHQVNYEVHVMWIRLVAVGSSTPATFLLPHFTHSNPVSARTTGARNVNEDDGNDDDDDDGGMRDMKDEFFFQPYFSLED